VTAWTGIGGGLSKKYIKVLLAGKEGRDLER
jgi:hypothetical protein